MLKLSAYRHGPQFTSDPDQIIWLSSGDKPEKTSALQVARRLNMTGDQPHWIYHPITGETVQMTSESYRATACHSPARAIVVVVVGSPEKGFTAFDCPSLGKLLGKLPRLSFWAYGPPTGVPVRRTPNLPGHYSGDQISPDYPGVGQIDIRRLMTEPMPEEFPVPDGIGEISQDPDYIPETEEDEGN